MSKLADPATWYRALYLPERVGLRHATRPDAGALADRARRRAMRWKESFPLDATMFARRLRSDGLDEDGLASVLDQPGEDIIARLATRPPWLAEVLAAHAGPPAGPLDLPEPLASHALAGLLTMAAPLLHRARARLLRVLEGLHEQRPAPVLGPAYDPPRLLAELFAPLPGLVLRMLSRTLILELHAARLAGQLAGDTPEARYQAFVATLASHERALALYQEYPVLARCLAETIARWEAVMGELAARLVADWPALIQTFFAGQPPGPVVEVHAGAGDAHGGGRSVMILGFASGGRVVYKPRSLLVDQRFQALLAWLDQRGDHPRFRALRLLRRERYGWVEHIEHRACQSRAQAARFFERQGAYLALFHALEATDMHYENLIAHGEHPVPVDLESLFQPRVALEQTDPEPTAAHELATSVLRVGLLPHRPRAEGRAEEIDLGGLSSVRGQLTPDELHSVDGAGTDEPRMVRRRLPMSDGRNLPTLAGQELSARAHERDLLRGFTGMYWLLVEHRDELLAGDGPLAGFAEVPVRVILRPTRTYAALLRESFHPELMSDALNRDRLFDALWERVDVQPRLWPAIQSELADLRQGDIPMFTGRPNARHVTDARGAVIEGLIEQPGLARARARIAGFGDDDLRAQIRLIQASLTTMEQRPDTAAAREPAPPRAGR